MTNRRPIRAASSTGVRARSAQSLAPAHLGEATAAATVAVMVGGIALVISGIGIVVMALTIGARYGGDPPPNVGSLALLPAALGALLLLLGAGLTAGGLGVLAAARRARLLTGALAGLTAGLAALGAVLVMITPPANPVIAVALTIATLVFGVSALLLLRPRR
ncbi:MAG TPA: hypothetical protein VM253_02505 [Candidatus Limnocylindrales bacterium]|nr:hypothetical protein [Candidatus Limnocylindrales bacterium]